MIKFLFIFTFVFCAFVQNVYAQVMINEIMYDAPGSDDGHEWIEIKNTGNTAVDLSLYRFFEAAVNHKITAVLGATLSSGGYAIIADDAAKFQTDFPLFSGVLYDSSFSLSNAGEVISIKLDDVALDSVSYLPNELADGTGGTLQKVGSSFVALSATPGVSSDSGSPVVVESSSLPSSNSNAVNNSNNQSSQNSSSETSGIVADQDPVRIIPDAGNDQTVIAGAPIILSGKATVGGKPIPDTARFLWNFGDGSTFIGRSTNHVYRSPGRYLASLSVSFGETSATDMITIVVIESPISIASAISGPDGYVSLLNNAKGIIDISTWYLAVGNQIFVFPVGTFIAGSSVVRFDTAVTKLSFLSPDQVVLRFPSGKDASRGTFELVTQEVVTKTEIITKPKIEETKIVTPASVVKKESPKKVSPSVDIDETVSVSDNFNQTAFLEGSIDSSKDEQRGSFWWYGALIVVLALGTVGVVMIEKKKPVDEFEIIEADE